MGDRGVLDGLCHVCCGVLARVSPGIMGWMIRPCRTLHYYSTKEESCEARRLLPRVCSSSIAPGGP